MTIFWKSNYHYFLTCGKCSSFTEAALLLGITQASLSLSITKLEEELGFELFFRSKNGILLSPKGTSLFNMLNETDKNLESSYLNLENEKISPRLRLGIRPSTFRTRIEPQLNRLIHKFPNLQIFLMNSKKLLGAIENYFLDVAILGNSEPPKTSLKVDLFEKINTPWVAHKAFFPNFNKIKTFEDLKKFPIAQVGVSIDRAWTNSLGINQHGYITDDYNTFCYFILKGLAVGQADSDYFTKKELKNLTQIQLPGGLQDGFVWIMSPPEKLGNRSQSRTELINFLKSL